MNGCIKFLFLVIIEAIELLTGKFDKNLVYRQILANTSGTEPEILDPIVGIISITVPTVAGKFNFLFYPKYLHTLHLKFFGPNDAKLVCVVQDHLS